MAERFTKMVNDTFAYYETLGDFYQDSIGTQAVRNVRDRIVGDLGRCSTEPSTAELKALCRHRRKLRIEPEGKASFPPDMFIESICQVIELS